MLAVVVDIRLEGSGIDPLWTGDRVLGVCAALCVCRLVGVVENGVFCGVCCRRAFGRSRRWRARSEGQDMKVLRRMAIVVCSECGMNMNILEVGVVSLLSSLSS